MGPKWSGCCLEVLWRASRRRWPLPDYGQKKGRETFQKEGVACTKAQRKEEHAGNRMTNSSAGLDKVLVGQEKPSPDCKCLAQALHPTPTFWHTRPQGFRQLPAPPPFLNVTSSVRNVSGPCVLVVEAPWMDHFLYVILGILLVAVCVGPRPQISSLNPSFEAWSCPMALVAQTLLMVIRIPCVVITEADFQCNTPILP